MNETATINELATALAKAQQQFTHATKDSRNPHFGNKYADLASVWEAIRGPLTANGLSVSQLTYIDEHGAVVLVTRLLHSSGQWIESRYPVIPTKPDPQGYGSAMTYARRYCLAAIVGIAQDDDDGNAASERPAASKSAQVRQPQKTAAPVAAGPSGGSVPSEHEGLVLDYQSRIDEQTTREGIDAVGVEIAHLHPSVQQALRRRYKAKLAAIIGG